MILRVSIVLLFATVATAVAGRTQVFRSGVDVVELNVVVSTGNRSVGGLTAEDFAVTDNGVAQTVTSVSLETMPIDVTLVIDSSASISPQLADAIGQAGNKVRDQLRPTDRVSLMTFNQLIHERLALGPAGSAGLVELGRRVGATALNDAIAVALTTPPPVDRRSMVMVFTDGYDTMSFLDEARVLEIAGRSRSVLFIVAKAVTGAFPKAFFDALAGATGGLVQIVPVFGINPTVAPGQNQVRTNPALLDEAFLKALLDFRSAYVLRYTLTGVPRPGWHDVSVRVTKSGRKYDVRTRRGYQW